MTGPSASKRLHKVISVNTTDIGGGAERMAWCLFKGYERRGLDSWLAVGNKQTDDPRVMPFFLSPHINYYPYGLPGVQLLQKGLKRLDRALGREDYHFPYSKYLPMMTGSRPDAIHLHNLHGGYFDPRALERLSQDVPVFVTLHDQWWMTGHCANSFECDRWRTGCGACPHLDTPPALERDATRFNWQRKRDIYSRSRLRVAAGSKWLLDLARQSILAPALVESRLIPYGIDLNTFRPGSQEQARDELGIPANVHLALFVAYQARSNPLKDYPSLRSSMLRLAKGVAGREVHFYCVGEAGPDERVDRLLIRHIPFQDDTKQLARYYQAADVYVHSAIGEVFGIVIAEALACGTPVVAVRTGGIPEAFVDREEGFLVEPRATEPFAAAVQRLFLDPELRKRFGQRGAERARLHYDQERMIDTYLDWFREGIASETPRAA